MAPVVQLRAALDAGSLEEATRQAEIAEGHAAAARAKRRELEEVQLEQVQLQTADGGGDGVYRTCSGGTVSTGSPPKASDAELFGLGPPRLAALAGS